MTTDSQTSTSTPEPDKASDAVGGRSTWTRSARAWRRPPQADLLFYDSVCNGYLQGLVARHGGEFLHARREALSVPATLKALIRRVTTKPRSPFWGTYLDAYVDMVSPTVLGTNIDNDPHFHVLARRHPSVHSFAVQHGWRSSADWAPLSAMPGLAGSSATMFVFNEDVARRYRDACGSRAIVVGSTMSNAIPVSTPRSDGPVTFVSQFIQGPPGMRLARGNSGCVRLQEFRAADEIAVRVAADFARDAGAAFAVIGRPDGVPRAEEAYFRDVLGPTMPFRYITSENAATSYRAVDEARLLVTVDSTLGYEALGRRSGGVAILACRSHFIGDQSYRFAWPALLPTSGTFWSTDPTVASMRATLELALEQGDYSVEERSLCEKIMPRDEGNATLERWLDGHLGHPARVPGARKRVAR